MARNERYGPPESEAEVAEEVLLRKIHALGPFSNVYWAMGTTAVLDALGLGLGASGLPEAGLVAIGGGLLAAGYGVRHMARHNSLQGEASKFMIAQKRREREYDEDED